MQPATLTVPHDKAPNSPWKGSYTCDVVAVTVGTETHYDVTYKGMGDPWTQRFTTAYDKNKAVRDWTNDYAQP